MEPPAVPPLQEIKPSHRYFNFNSAQPISYNYFIIDNKHVASSYQARIHNTISYVLLLVLAGMLNSRLLDMILCI